MLRLRAYGIYAFRVVDPAKFMKEVFGTSSEYSVDGLEGQLKRSIVSGISDLIAEFNKPAIDLAMYYDELSVAAKQKVQERFDVYGLEISSLYIENISLPEEVEKVLDQRTSMGVMGNQMNKFTQYQAAQAIRDAAQNEGRRARRSRRRPWRWSGTRQCLCKCYGRRRRCTKHSRMPFMRSAGIRGRKILP